ncbi:MAG TPA: HD domain-containing phosphohydrolase [Candidatus Methylomirabilis sp.]|nr:HD domain-containing phosphohydrolase [Candidatus Methylomirabilis sp.]
MSTAVAEQGPVLIVDDDQDVREMLHDIFRSSGFQCQVASNGREALQVFEAAHPQLTVTDVRMPVMDGVEFLRHARAVDSDAVVLILTGVGDVRTAVESLTSGAYDFILKPVNPDELLQAAGRALEHRRSLLSRREQHEQLQRRVAEATRELEATLRRLEDTYRSTLEALGSAIDTRDVGTHAHSRRVRGYSLVIARAHGVTGTGLRDIEHGVLLHDIGKIGIPDSILLKPGPLTPAEWKIMRRHPEIGRQLIEKIPFLSGAVPIVYHHHERWDGTGYPLGLRGEAIPLGARIFAVADALDAMTFDRPYSRAIPLEAAQAEIRRCAGSHFDPAVVDTFAGISLDVFAAIRQSSEEAADSADEVEAALLAVPGLARALNLATRDEIIAPATGPAQGTPATLPPPAPRASRRNS